MLICLTTIFLCQMQSWNEYACYILAHLCAILIPSAASITGILLMRWSKWGLTTLCWLQNCTFCWISQLHVDGFLWDFYNRDSFDETIENLLYLVDHLHHPLLPAFNLHTHTYIHIYIYAHMLMCLTTIFLCQMQFWNQCACYILAHHCAVMIPSVTGTWILKWLMSYVIFWVKQFK